jgi:hypothetical protein
MSLAITSSVLESIRIEVEGQLAVCGDYRARGASPGDASGEGGPPEGERPFTKTPRSAHIARWPHERDYRPASLPNTAMPLTTSIVLSAPGDPADLNSFLTDAFRFRHRPRLLRLGFALAKESGVDAFEAAVPDEAEWRRARKEWLIGTQFALTEPEALHRLYDMSSSVVRLHGWRPATGPSREAMFRVGSYHPKLIAAGGANVSRITALFIGSANLTGAALGSVPMNYEAAMSLTAARITPSLVAAFNEWWNRSWNESVELSRSVIDEYARARATVLEENPDLQRFVEASVRDGPEFGSDLWIEAGAMSGGARNQIEFSEDLVPFFGPAEQSRRHLRIRLGGRTWVDRPLSYKVTTFGVEIWRLSLPTQAKGGVDYVGRVIRFQRSGDGDGLVFDLQVADPGSATFRRWRRESEVRGHVGVTGGGRDYGLA